MSAPANSPKAGKRTRSTLNAVYSGPNLPIGSTGLSAPMQK